MKKLFTAAAICGVIGATAFVLKKIIDKTDDFEVEDDTEASDLEIEGEDEEKIDLNKYEDDLDKENSEYFFQDNRIYDYCNFLEKRYKEVCEEYEKEKKLNEEYRVVRKEFDQLRKEIEEFLVPQKIEASITGIANEVLSNKIKRIFSTNIAEVTPVTENNPHLIKINLLDTEETKKGKRKSRRSKAEVESGLTEVSAEAEAKESSLDEPGAKVESKTEGHAETGSSETTKLETTKQPGAKPETVKQTNAKLDTAKQPNTEPETARQSDTKLETTKQTNAKQKQNVTEQPGIESETVKQSGTESDITKVDKTEEAVKEVLEQIDRKTKKKFS